MSPSPRVRRNRVILASALAAGAAVALGAGLLVGGGGLFGAGAVCAEGMEIPPGSVVLVKGENEISGKLAGLVEAGLTPQEALRTAITNPARLFGLSDLLVIAFQADKIRQAVIARFREAAPAVHRCQRCRSPGAVRAGGGGRALRATRRAC